MSQAIINFMCDRSRDKLQDCYIVSAHIERDYVVLWIV